MITDSFNNGCVLMFYNVLVNAGKLVDRVTETATRSYFLFWFEIELNKSFKGID